MKNWKTFKVGEKVKITSTHGDDLGKEGEIVEVRCSFCKINIDGKIVNHTYAQFKRI